jgi:hypothetical protein
MRVARRHVRGIYSRFGGRAGGRVERSSAERPDVMVVLEEAVKGCAKVDLRTVYRGLWASWGGAPVDDGSRVRRW